MEVSQIGSENVHGFSCGNFSAAKEPVLGSPCSLACLLSLPPTPSLRGKHHQIKTHSTGNYKILQISWIWSWQAVKPFNIVPERKKKQKEIYLTTKPSAVLWSFHPLSFLWRWHEPLLMMMAPDLASLHLLLICSWWSLRTWWHQQVILLPGSLTHFWNILGRETWSAKPYVWRLNLIHLWEG